MDFSKFDGYYARRSYDNIVLQQSHITFKGLWILGDQLFIHCPQSSDPELKTLSGEKLSKWIREHKIIGVPPILLAATIPDGAVEIPPRTIEDITLSKSEPLTILDYERLLLLQLPHEFPFFKINSEPPKLIYTIERALNAEEQSLLDIAHDSLNTILEPVFLVNQNIQKESPYEILNAVVGHSLHLLNSRYISGQSLTSANRVKKLCEEDEDFWSDNKMRLFTKNIQTPFDFIPANFSGSQSACFVNASVYPPKNMRSYLTLFQRIIMNMPLLGNIDNFMNGLSIKNEELIRLIECGKIQFVLPQSIDRYSPKFLETILDVNPNCMISSRRLAAITVAGIRRRMPLLFPSLGSVERQEIANEIAKICAEDKENHFFHALRDQLGNLWLNMITNIDAQGAMAVASHGISSIVSILIQQIHNVDRFLEVYFSTMPLEWAMALQASLIPNDESQEKYAGISAAFYSKIGNNPKTILDIDTDVLLKKLFMLDNDCPISEIIPFCTESITDRFLKIVQNSDRDKIAENLNLEVEQINKQILSYEKNAKRLVNYDLLGGLIVELATKCLPTEYAALEYLGLGMIVTGTLFNRRVFSPNLTDWLQSIATLTPRDSIFIGRMRKSL